MESFWYWLESQKINDYLGGVGNAQKIEQWLLNHGEVRDFLTKIDQMNLVKPEVGKKGYLVMSRGAQYDPFSGAQYYDNPTGNSYQHRIPVTIVNLQGNQAEVARTDNRDFGEIGYKVPHYPDPKQRKLLLFRWEE